MMNKLLMKYIPRILIVLTLGTIIFMLCAGIIDRKEFHCQVKKAAIADIKTLLGNNKNSAFYCSMDSVNNATISDIDKQISTSNSIIVINKPSDDQDNQPYSKSLLYVLSQSDGLLNANGLTFCVTLVVSLLAALLLYKIDTNDKLIEQNRTAFKETEKIIQQKTKVIQKEIEKYKNETSELKKENKKLKETTQIIKSEYTLLYDHTAKFNQLLVRIESLYNLTILIGNLSVSLLTGKEANNNLLENVGTFCSRLSLICREIDDRLNNQDCRLDFLTKDEKEIINTYFEDAIGELMRVQDTAKRIGSNDLISIIKNNTSSVKNIMDMIDNIQMKN